MGEKNEGLSPRREYFVNSVSIIGPNGQLGTDLVKVFSEAGWEIVPITHAEASVEDYESVRNVLKRMKTHWVINTSAFHKIDDCEKDSEKAWSINTMGAKNVAVAAKEIGMRSVFISTDYVYSGSKGSAYTENDYVSPINAYGFSKAGGEVATLATSEDNLVVRIASVFGTAGSSGKGGNFVETVISKAKAGETLHVVDDILMSPTYALDASKKIYELLKQEKNGVFNVSNSGSTSWFNFARQILQKTNLETQIISSATNWEAVPRRPKNSTLNISKVEKILTNSPTWSDGLQEYLLEKGHIK
jgi:dTDP-4-dehydrorhamnose reductase